MLFIIKWWWWCWCIFLNVLWQQNKVIDSMHTLYSNHNKKSEHYYIEIFNLLLRWSFFKQIAICSTNLDIINSAARIEGRLGIYLRSHRKIWILYRPTTNCSIELTKVKFCSIKDACEFVYQLWPQLLCLRSVSDRNDWTTPMRTKVVLR